MTTTAPSVDTFTLTEEIVVHASLEDTWASLVAQLGERNELPDGTRFPMVLEPTVGGRWYRDLGEGNGHFWAMVQSVKRPLLLELWGPLFMSTGATSNVMYRITEHPDGSMIAFRHTVVGPFPEAERPRMGEGWTAIHSRVKRAAEAGGARG